VIFLKKIIIKALTKTGSLAIEKHNEGASKMSRLQRAQFKLMGYKHNVVSRDPWIVEFVIKRKQFYKNPQFMDLIIGEIEKSLEANGARNTQYKKNYQIKIE